MCSSVPPGLVDNRALAHYRFAMVDEIIFLIAFCAVEIAIARWTENRSVSVLDHAWLKDEVTELRKENHTGDLRERIARLETLVNPAAAEENAMLRERVASLESLYEVEEEAGDEVEE